MASEGGSRVVGAIEPIELCVLNSTHVPDDRLAALRGAHAQHAAYTLQDGIALATTTWHQLNDFRRYVSSEHGSCPLRDCALPAVVISSDSKTSTTCAIVPLYPNELTPACDISPSAGSVTSRPICDGIAMAVPRVA